MSATSTDARHEAVRRALRPVRRYADAEVSRMMRQAADLFDERGEHDTAKRLRNRAEQLAPDDPRHEVDHHARR